MDKAAGKVIKEYPQRGPMQQFRLESSRAFHCFRCGQDKTSRLVTVYGGDWSRLLCNGCYGRLLSIFTIKKGTGDEEQKAEALGEVLLARASNDERQQATKRLLISERRAGLLSERALKFIATSEYVAQHLTAGENLDWSAAVIGLCKALEIETVSRIIDPLRATESSDFSEDSKDKDFGRVAKYCSGVAAAAPELGTLKHFLQTAKHSVSRQQTSALLGAVKIMVMQWPHSDWLFRDDGLPKVLDLVTTRFRNRAAHTDELTKEDYESCRQAVVGPDGALWMLINASQTVKQARGFQANSAS
jgi:hypothetical protein